VKIFAEDGRRLKRFGRCGKMGKGKGKGGLGVDGENWEALRGWKVRG
jgi:hypothetical protein